MKTMIFKSLLTVFLGSFLILSACAKKSSSSSNRAGTTLRGNALTGANNANISQLSNTRCTDGSSGWGRLFDDGTMAGTAFRDSYANYLSAVMDPQYLGTIDGSSTSASTGVNMELKLKIVNNQLDLSQTRFAMEINDSNVGQVGSDGQPFTAISIPYSNASSGQITNVNGNTGSFQLVFTDSYGTVNVSGTFNGTEARGNVTFNNTASSDGGSVKSGKLGAFYMKSCGLFN